VLQKGLRGIAVVDPGQDGVPDLVDRVEAHYGYLAQTGLLARKEEERVRDELVALVQHELTEALLASLRPGELDEWVRRVARREADPYTAARDLVHRGGR
jgi:LAO/AO transport system kinase